MSEISAAEYRRRDDEAIANISLKMDAMRVDMHQLDIHMAELKVISTGRVDQLEYRIAHLEGKEKEAGELALATKERATSNFDRLARIEGNMKVVVTAVASLVTTFATAVIMWLIQQWGNGTVSK